MFHRHDYKFRLCFYHRRKTNLIYAREDLAYYEQMLTGKQKTPIARVSLHYKVHIRSKLEERRHVAVPSQSQYMLYGWILTCAQIVNVLKEIVVDHKCLR